MSPLEKMARAHYEASRFRAVDDMGSPVRWEGLAQFQRDDKIASLRAALRAIREPDEAMIEAWFKAERPWGPVVSPLSQASSAFRRNHAAMIDAILNQEPRP